MINHTEISREELRKLLVQKLILFGGNSRLKIYGTLQCLSGKRMKTGNRVFFTCEEEALSQGFRPCGHCMKGKYKKWKNGLI